MARREGEGSQGEGDAQSRALSRGGRRCRAPSVLALDCYMQWR